MKKKILLVLMLLVSCVFACFGVTACSDDGGFGSGGGDSGSGHSHIFTETVRNDYLKSSATCQSKAIYYKSCSCGAKSDETFEYGELGEHCYVSVRNGDGTHTRICEYDNSHTLIEDCKDINSDHRCDICRGKLTNCKDEDNDHYCDMCNKKLSDCKDEDNDHYCDMCGITIPDSVTSIGAYAFEDCSSLTSVTIGKSVTSIGEYAFLYCSSLEEITLPFIGNTKDGTENTHFGYIFGASKYSDNNTYVPSSLKKVVITSVTSIPSCAFYGCSGLTSVTIPDSVTSIGAYAFRDCTGLTSITIPDSVTSIGSGAFIYCSGLTSVIIGNSVTSIGSYAFKGCDSLTSVTIGNSVTSIGEYAFFGCYKLVEVINKSSLTIMAGNYGNGDVARYVKVVHNGESKIVTVDDYQFMTVDGINYLIGYVGTATELTLPANYNGENYVINDYAFRDCTGLTSVTIPDSVTSIGGDAFNNCYNLTSVTIPDSVTSIGSAAFYDCRKLTSVTIPDSVTSIGGYAFYDCRKLTSVTIPDSVTSIGWLAFYGCSSLEEITLPFIGNIKDGTNSAYLGYIFGASTYFDNNTYVPSSLKKVVITSVTSIGGYAFYDCRKLRSITIPDSVTSIGDYAFYKCSSLTSITIPDSVTSIGEYAFYDCDSLTSITIPDSVTSIGEYAFRYCTGLTSVIIGNSVKSIGYSAFYGCSSLEEITLPFIGNTKDGTENTHFGYIFGASKYSDNNTYVPSSLKKVVITSVTSIGGYAFYDCRKLRSVTIPDSVTSIGEYAFRYCSSLTSVTIPDSVTSIGYSAFRDCTGLTSVIIGNSVKSIGDNAFYNCTALTTVYYGGTARQWNNITICSYNTKLTSATRYYYSESQPATSGNYWHYDEEGNPVVW